MTLFPGLVTKLCNPTAFTNGLEMLVKITIKLINEDRIKRCRADSSAQAIPRMGMRQLGKVKNSDKG